MYARISAYLVACALVFTGLASAQERFGALTGRVSDQQGQAIPGVTVVTTNIQTGEVRTFVTDANGQFTAPDLVPGRYNVRFELTGFSKVERADISFDAVKQLVLARVEQRPARLDLARYPYLPTAEVRTTAAADYATLLSRSAA